MPVKKPLITVGWKMMSMGKSSSLPASISNIITSFEGLLQKEKFLAGPTRFRPGPILLMVAAIAVKFVTRSCPSKDTAKMDAVKIIIKVVK